MARPPRLTRRQKAILKAPRAELRRVSLIEKIANPGRFSLKGEYFVPKAVKKVGARTAFVAVSRKKDFTEGASHSKAAAERAAGERPYKTAASEAQAGAARETFRLKRRVKVLDANARVSRPKYFTKGPRRGERGEVRERVTDSGRDNYFRHRRRKLAGQWIDDGDWHEMMAVARAINDPMLSALIS